MTASRKTAAKRLRAAAAMLLSILLFPLTFPAASASQPVTKNDNGLSWELYANPIVGDWDYSNPGDELRITYNILNTSSPGDAHNLINFTIHAGSNQGVYSTTIPTGWTATIHENHTFFAGNGDYIGPSGAATFRLFSYYLTTTEGQANATASFPEGTPFPTLSDIPVPAIPSASSVRLLAASSWEGDLGEPAPTPDTHVLIGENLYTGMSYRVWMRENLHNAGDWQDLGTLQASNALEGFRVELTNTTHYLRLERLIPGQ